MIPDQLNASIYTTRDYTADMHIDNKQYARYVVNHNLQWYTKQYRSNPAFHHSDCNCQCRPKDRWISRGRGRGAYHSISCSDDGRVMRRIIQ